MLQDYKNLYIFTTLSVRDADRTCLLNFGMRVEDLVDIARIDVKPSRDDQVLLPVHDIEVSVFVHGRDIAGIAPAVPEQDFCFFRVVQVSFSLPEGL